MRGFRIQYTGVGDKSRLIAALSYRNILNYKLAYWAPLGLVAGSIKFCNTEVH